MKNYKEFVGDYFKGKRLHLKCDCIIGIDVQGFCIDYEINSSELTLVLDVNGKRIPIGTNTPKLQIEII